MIEETVIKDELETISFKIDKRVASKIRSQLCSSHNEGIESLSSWIRKAIRTQLELEHKKYVYNDQQARNILSISLKDFDRRLQQIGTESHMVFCKVNKGLDVLSNKGFYAQPPPM